MKRKFVAIIATNILVSVATAFGLPNYLILYVPVSSAMTTQVNRLKTLKEGQGFEVVVKTSDYIYGLYGTGTAEERIKQYIADAYANPSYDLRYVLIISSHDWEPAGHIPINFYRPPPPELPTAYSDDWYVDIEGDDFIPDISVGRLPFTEGNMLENYIDKLELYALHSGENWNKKVLISVEDYDDTTWMPPGWTHEQYFDWLRVWAAEVNAAMPSEIITDELRSSSFAPDNHIEYRNRVDSGRSVNIHLGYARHTSIGGENYPFVIPDPTGPRSVTYFNNSPKFTFHYVPSCTVGRITYDDGPFVCTVFNSIADKAAIGLFAPITTIDVLNNVYPFTPYFLNSLFKTNDAIIGDVVRKAKETAYKAGGDMTAKLPYFELLCDPGLTLNIPHECVPKVLDGFPIPLYANQTYPPAVASANLYPPLTQGAPVENPPYLISGSEPRDIVVPSMWATWSYDDDGDQNFVAPVPESPTASVVADVNSDGLFEVIAIAEERVNAYDNDGEMLDNFPVTLNEGSYYPAAVGDINGDGYLDIVVASVDRVYVIDHNGSELFHADLPADYFPIGSPAVGDLDHNGDLEIVVGTQSFSYDSCICVYDKNGNPKSGWHKYIGSETVQPPALADLTGDGTVEVIVASNNTNLPLRAYYRVIAHTGTSINFTYYDNYVFEFTPAVGDFVPWGGEWYGKEAVVVSYDTSVSEYKILVLDADDGSTIRTISMGNKVPTSAPTIGDVDNFGANEVVVGCDGYLMAYCLDWGGVPFNGHWHCPLKGAVTTPIVTHLNGYPDCDIVCSDEEGIHAFTTNMGYIPPSYDWIRECHDNMNMGLWDIAAPTGVVAEDYHNDQGGKIVIAWTPSVDNDARSRRVAKYTIYRKMGEAEPPGSDGILNGARAVRKKLAEGRRVAALSGSAFIQPASLRPDASNPGRLTDDAGASDAEVFLHIATVTSPTFYYVDEGLENLREYKYYVVATDLSETYKSQRSVIVSAAPHDNIPPAPPTNFAGDVIEDGTGNVYIHLSWDLSFDDPYYSGGQPGDGSPAVANVYAPAPTPAASGIRPAGAVASVYAGNDSPIAESFRASAGPGLTSFPLSEKEGEALKV